MKSNFTIKKPSKLTRSSTVPNDSKTEYTKEEFEEFILKTGAAGSFMVFRSDKKEDELGLDEL